MRSTAHDDNDAIATAISTSTGLRACIDDNSDNALDHVEAAIFDDSDELVCCIKAPDMEQLRLCLKSHGIQQEE